LKRIKHPDIYTPPLTGIPEQQWIIMRSGVLTSSSNRQCSTISGRLQSLNEWTLGLLSKLDRPTVGLELSL